MKQTAPVVREIAIADIKNFVDRSRDAEMFQWIVESMADPDIGQQVPIQVRDITHWPAEKRKRPEGGHYKYERIVGEGRIAAAKQLGWKKIWAEIVEAEEKEIVGRFLAENINRESLPWSHKAKLMRPEFDAGKSSEEIAKRFHVSVSHVEKCRRVFDKTATGLEERVLAMPLNTAEVLVTLPANDQHIVVQALQETGASDADLKAYVAKARAVKQEAESLSVTALKKSIERVSEERNEIFGELKVIRWHWSHSIPNLQILLADPKFKSSLKKEGVNYAKFENLIQ